MNKFQKELIKDRIENERLHLSEKSNALIAGWLMNAINDETRTIVENGKQPSKIYFKYPFPVKENRAVIFQSAFGNLDVIVDPAMNELMRVE